MKIAVELYPDEYLRLMRIRLEMTQSMLAKRLGVSRQMVNYYENGIIEVSIDRLDAVRRMVDG
jgi:transcriptional regulator with XRE-family HTH domain